MGSRKDIAKEDLAIQDTLSMSAEEPRVELLANLIVERLLKISRIITSIKKD